MTGLGKSKSSSTKHRVPQMSDATRAVKVRKSGSREYGYA